MPSINEEDESAKYIRASVRWHFLASAKLMSKLVFNGQTHQISLVGDDGKTKGTWAAYNNVDSHASLTHVPNRTYLVQDRTAPHHHRASANGPYGLHGIIRFNMAGHPGVGVHSGRANARHLPGPAHPTMGCIRTTDEAMRSIAALMRTEQLWRIEVIHNSAAMAHASSARNRNRHLHGHHHA